MDAAISALSAERSGVGSALIMAMRQVGGTMGVAILGTLLSTGYRNKLDLHGLSGEAAESVRRNVSAGVAVARQINSTTLIDSVRSSFIHGMEITLWVCGGVAALGVLITLSFLQTRVDRNVKSELEQTTVG